jgi:hypothetical protein
VAMLILKEGFGWSDEQLFEAIHFNLLVRRALGFLGGKTGVRTQFSLIYLLLDSAKFSDIKGHAANCNGGHRSKSVLSRMNFLKLCSSGLSKRNSGSVFCSARATTASEGG